MPMETLDLEEFETHLTVRPIRVEDHARLVELQEACFPGMPTWRQCCGRGGARAEAEGLVPGGRSRLGRVASATPGLEARLHRGPPGVAWQSWHPPRLAFGVPCPNAARALTPTRS